jgi:hypothetical protein
VSAEASMPRKTPEKPGKQRTAAELREQRLAEALRANLKRRKAAGAQAASNTSGKPSDGKD